MNVNTIRKITIEAETKGVDAAAASVKGLDAAQKGLTTSTQATATVTDMATKRQLSAADAYKRQTLAVVEGARAQEQYAKQVRIADQYLKQGGITAQEHAQRIGLLQQKYGEAGTASQRLATATQGLGRAFDVAKGALAAFGVAMGVAALINFGKQIFNTTADLAEQAQQLGINVEAMQAFRGIFLQNGIEVAAGDKIIQRLTRTLGEAADGTKKSQEAFAKLGLGAKELAGTSADSALPLIAKRLLEIEDVTARAKIETDLFGKSGQQLESALKALAAGSMSDLIAKGKELGIVIDKEMIEKADQAKDRMALAWMKLSVTLAPIITNWVDAFTRFTEKIGGSTSEMEKLIDKMQVVAGVWAGMKAGGLFGPVGSIVGAATGGMVAYGAAHQQELDQAAIARYKETLAKGNLSGSERKDYENRLNALQNKYVGYSGLVDTRKPTVSATELGYAIEPGGGAGWDSTSEAKSAAAAAAKKAAADAKKIADAKEIKALDKEIAQAADEQVKSALKLNEYKQDYIDQQNKLAADTEQYLVDLETEVKLAGMSREQREIELAVMEGMRTSGGTINREQVEGLVRARQETEQWRDVVDDISRGFEDMFEDIFKTGKLSFDSLWDSVKSGFARMLAQMANQQLFQPLIGSLFGGGGGVASAASSLFGSGSGGMGGIMDLLGMGSNVSSMFGGGGGGLLSSLFGGGAASPFTFGADPSGLFSAGSGSLFGGSGGLFGASGLGGVMGGVGLGSLASSLIFGNKNSAGIGGMGGAAAGALLGSIVPGIGTIIGGLAGGLLGGGLGSMTGTSNQGAISNFTDGGLGNTLFKAGGGNNGAMATQATGSINAALKALQDAGVSVSLGNISGLSIGSDKSYVYDLAGGKQKLAGGEAGIQATVDAILTRVLPSASGTTDEASALLSQYGGLNAGNIAQFITDINAQQQEKAQQEAQESADAAAESAQALADQFNALGGDLKTFADTLQNSAKAWQGIADGWGDAHTALAQAYSGLLISSPGLSPVDRYNNSRSQFDNLLNSARGGSYDSAKDLASFGSEFLQTSYQFNGSTAGYGQDFSYVQDALREMAGTSEAQQNYAQRQADSLAAAVEKLSAIYNAISEAANQNNEGLAALRSELDEIKGEISRMNDAAQVAASG